MKIPQPLSMQNMMELRASMANLMMDNHTQKIVVAPQGAATYKRKNQNKYPSTKVLKSVQSIQEVRLEGGEKSETIQ